MSSGLIYETRSNIAAKKQQKKTNLARLHPRHHAHDSDTQREKKIAENITYARPTIRTPSPLHSTPSLQCRTHGNFLYSRGAPQHEKEPLFSPRTRKRERTFGQQILMFPFAVSAPCLDRACVDVGFSWCVCGCGWEPFFP